MTKAPEDLEIGDGVEFVHYDAYYKERGVDIGVCTSGVDFYNLPNGETLLYVELKVKEGLRIVIWRDSRWHDT